MASNPWRVLRFSDPGFDAASAKLNRTAQPEAGRAATVAAIIEAVRQRGDEALLAYAREFDKVDLALGNLLLPPRGLEVPDPVRAAVEYSINNIRAFSKMRKPRNWTKTNREGATVGEKFDPLQRVGIYVPGGTAPLVSSALMTVTLAREAGVPEIVAMTPPPVNEMLHYALRQAGATEIYQVGGAQAIAAMAYGTASIRRVQKVFGPGNAFVIEAKRQVVGAVAIDQLPGPSEIAVVADEGARADFVAADLLAQAEHGAGSQVLFLTPSPALLAEVEQELLRQTPTLSRVKHLGGVMENGCTLVLTASLAGAIELVENFAPEHLTLITKDARKLAQSVVNAGAIFIGNFSPVAAGDFVAGPSHELPTGGAAKAFSGLTIDQFYRRTSIVEYSQRALAKVASHIETFCAVEQLDAHARSVAIRFEK